MSNTTKHFYEFGPFRVDPGQRLLLRDQQPVPLQPKAFETLLTLVQHSETVVLKDDLMKSVWPNTFVEESNLAQNIFVLRKTLEDSVNGRRYIVTIPGRGYRFAEKVRIISPDETTEELVLETHSRSHVVIEEETLPRRTLQEVVARFRWPLLAGLFGLTTAAGAFSIWAFNSPPPAPRMLRSVQLTHSGRITPYSRILTDGARLYFTETRGGTWSLAQLSTAGGEPAVIATSLPNLTVHDIDATKSRLLVEDQSPDTVNPLWIIPTEGGSAQRVGDVIAADGASWSPDGRGIVYGNGSDIYVVDEENGQTRKLLTAPGRTESPRFSPDGQLLRFTVQQPGSGGMYLWEATADGRNAHPLSLVWKTDHRQWGEGDYCGDWTPDGKYFVFRSRRNGVESYWAIREKREWPHLGAPVPVVLYSSPDRLSEPRLSLDGKKLFFVDFHERRELARYDSARKLFVPYLGGIPARLVSYSPDGQWIAFRSDPDGTLWRSRIDGTQKLQLTFLPMFAMHSSWAPDGKTITFQGFPPGEASKLFSIPRDGGHPEILVSDPDATDTGPSWCPDNRLLFVHWTNRVAGVHASAVSELNMNTGKRRLLPGSEGFDGVNCSTDGKYAAASDQINHKLMLYDFAREQWSELSQGTPYGWGIRWSSDSRYVYYQHTDQGEEQPLFRIRISDARVEQIATSHDILRADVFSYAMTGLTPDNSPLVSLTHSNSDIYALDLDLP